MRAQGSRDVRVEMPRMYCYTVSYPILVSAELETRQSGSAGLDSHTLFSPRFDSLRRAWMSKNMERHIFVKL